MAPLTGPRDFALALSIARQRRDEGRFAEAHIACAHALAIRPDDPDALVLAGLIAFQSGRPKDAHALVSRALAIRPADTASRLILSGLAAALGDVQGAAEACRTAIALDPGSASAHLELGSLCVGQQRWEEARDCFRQATVLDPSMAVGHINLGSALFHLGQPDAAVASHQAALALLPHHPVALKNLAAALRANGDFDGALAAYRRAVSAQPDYAEARRDLGLLLLQTGDYAAGWQEYEWRWRAPSVGARPLGGTRWSGERFEGGRLLLHFEQGFGDSIQFLRYVPMAARDADVTVRVPPALARIAQSVSPDIGVSSDTEPLPAYDRYAYLMSLPRLLRSERPACPAGIPYLAAPADRVAAWRARLPPGPGLRVGVVWAGNPEHENDRSRSIPVAVLAPLVATPGMTFFSLQRDATPLAGMVDLAPMLTDFVETAAVLEVLDLLISVDTAACHLAGSIGRPVWTMLPHVADWRWGFDPACTPWYPTMRLFRQPRRGDWAATVAAVCEALRTRAGR